MGPAAGNLLTHMKELDRRQAWDFRRRRLRELVTRFVMPGAVLDVGCGAGFFAVSLAMAGHEIVAVDVEPGLTALAERRAQEAGVTLQTAAMRAEDVESLGEGRFANVICLDVLEHLPDDSAGIRASHHALVPGGRLIVAVPALPWLFGIRDRQLGHFRRYTKGSLRRLLVDSGFTVSTVRYWNAVGLLPYLIAEKVFRRPVSEAPRKRGGIAVAALRGIISGALYGENRIGMPLGLTLFAIAERPRS